jgi:hypothetical protein
MKLGRNHPLPLWQWQEVLALLIVSPRRRGPLILLRI